MHRLWIVLLLALVRVAAADCPVASTKQLPLARGTIVVDGILDDATWQRACFASDFTQKQPVFGAPPRHPVRVAVALDGDTLYVGARMWSAGEHDISDALTQRDDTSQAERFIVSFDPAHAQRLAYSFAVTARGVRADWVHTDDSEFDRDSSWNPVWRAEARIHADGWSAEMAIPLSQLRLPRIPATSWGINFNWYLPHRQEDVFWVSVPRDRTAWASMFGELTELPPIRPGLALELLPYVASRASFDEAPMGRLAPRWLAGFEAGLDLKLRPLPSFTIAATLNPDFGQVDADPAFVNLTAFEVRLPERRPFFIENNALFNNTGTSYFYSRRIGALPRYLPSAPVLALPQQVRILGALAGGGYIAPQTQIAVLGAVTDRADANAILEDGGRSLVISPLTTWTAARIEHQIGPSVLGATATTVARRLDGTGLAALLPSSAIALGGDARLRTEKRDYELGFSGGVTSVAGSAAAIERVQQSSAHWFQRPDAEHVEVDPTRHRMTGWQAGATAGKRAGLWQGEAAINAESPDYELNDLGQLASADDIDATLEVSRNVTTATEDVFGWSLGTSAYSALNFDGLQKPVELGGRSEVTLASFHNLVAAGQLVTPGYSDDLTRGGPRMRTGWAGNLTVGASTPSGRRRQLAAEITTYISPTLSQGIRASLSLIARVRPSLRVDIRPSISIVENHRQYVATSTETGGGALTYDTRYIFGHIQQREASVELRATWSLSADLVLTLYAQPFYSRGRYDELGELLAPGSDDLRLYSSSIAGDELRTIVDDHPFQIGEPNFDVVSLRSTAVLRYEPRPGSTLYVVWQQSRQRDIGFHTLALKLSWWFG